MREMRQAHYWYFTVLSLIFLLPITKLLLVFNQNIQVKIYYSYSIFITILIS